MISPIRQTADRPGIRSHCDKGDIEGYEASYMADTASFLEGVLGK